jgi:hypothetical protein
VLKAKAPVTLAVDTDIAVLPLLDSVTDCAADVDPAFVFAKVRLLPLTPAIASKPVPLNVAVWVVNPLNATLKVPL